MTTHEHPSLSRYLFAIASLLVLLLGSPGSTATAQPVAPEDTATRLEAMQHTLSNPDVRAKLTPAQWNMYSVNLALALASGHDGLHQGALRMVIQYGDYLHIKRPAVLDMVRIYRNHDNDNLRRMAVVALGKTHDAWAIDFLKRSARFEKTSSVRHTIQAVLIEQGAAKVAPSKVGGL